MLAAATPLASMVLLLTSVLIETLTVIADNQKRIADHFNPAPAGRDGTALTVARAPGLHDDVDRRHGPSGGIPGSSMDRWSGTGKRRKLSRGS